MEARKLTKAGRRALEWFAVREWASCFGPHDPSLTMVKRLADAGFLARVGRDRGAFGLARYAITGAGRAQLKDQSHG